MTKKQEELPGYLPGMTPPIVDVARERELNVDRTPIPIASQILSRTVEVFGPESMVSVVDAGCGEGGWGIALRRLHRPPKYSLGVDVRPEAVEVARNNYTRALCQRFEETTAPRSGPTFSSVVGNPPFSCFDERGNKKNLFPTFVRTALNLVSQSRGIVVFLALSDLGQRDTGRDVENSARILFRECPPFACFRIGAAIGFRGPPREEIDGSGQADQRSYSAWVWMSDGEGGSVPLDLGPSKDGDRGWYAEDLPALPSHDRKWKTIPGSS